MTMKKNTPFKAADRDSLLSHEDLISVEKALLSTLEKGFHPLRFPDLLENAYRAKEARQQKKLFPLLGAGALLLFLLYAIADYFLLPDIYKTAWSIRFFAVTPICAGILILIRSPSIPNHADILMVLALLTGTFAILLFLTLSKAPISAHYHTGILISVIFITIATRIRFHLALAACLLIFTAYAVSLPFVFSMPTAAKINSIFILATAILVCLVGCYQMEYRHRKEYVAAQMKKVDTLRLRYTNQELTRLSLSDPLTGLANRRHFDESLRRNWRKAARSGDSLALLFIDVDNFKTYNDNYGHPAGDECLKSIAGILKAHSRRPSDLPARFGGEEFVLLLPNTEKKQAAMIADSILQKVQKLAIRHDHSPVAPYLTISIGVSARIPDDETEAQTLLDRADAALYRAKILSKNRVEEN
ncbi:GGDEF domain-containing protein [Desulfobotulus sp. H1]|uniref:diguanylate cyclase n=1 Tax=Desulfobotulus pelophilus TaxID=2823377 RepID=A0ABT3NC17_9BACT|nr:GGDEF domain-containing protein [Desulfobotulus pelophilus]MCW7755006.1 GGDEF domain-containing protein [Desulfobotulus pelophilus]